jgi:hypothetical protein
VNLLHNRTNRRYNLIAVGKPGVGRWRNPVNLLHNRTNRRYNLIAVGEWADTANVVAWGVPRFGVEVLSRYSPIPVHPQKNKRKRRSAIE